MIRALTLDLKRIFDPMLALVGLVVLSPMLLFIAALVRLRIGAPVLFRQERPGQQGAPFTIYKFRTMTEVRNETGVLLSDARRMTTVGRWLRKTSLDELPELINVLSGKMCFVGPRPLLPQYLARYDAQQKRRHEVKPGITGWAQVNGRNAIDWEAKFALDVWYVDHVSPWLDLKILLMTVAHVFWRRGISHDGYATMPEFLGNGGGGKSREEDRP
ncbi:sugar transferase [bacterium]|nr:sugar transferase [bacterium]MBU1071693.1 sugar transferase [bacterium]MBU1676660.1 sugar transferase [bacterium]